MAGPLDVSSQPDSKPGTSDHHQQWDSEHDPDNPYVNHQDKNYPSRSDSLDSFNWPIRRKWRVTLIACYVTFIVGFNASSISAATKNISARFNISDANFSNSFWPITSWTVGAAIVPMLVLPMLETYGMRTGYLICYGLFTIFVIPQCIAQNFATLIVTRFFAGSCGGVLQDVLDGVIADVWPDAVRRSLPVTVYVFALLSGVSIGPVIGAGILTVQSWRWIFYAQLILYAGSAPLVYFLFLETRGPVILARQIRRKTGQKAAASHCGSSLSPASFLYEALIRPAHMLLTEPVVFCFTLLSAFTYGLVFISTQSVTLVYHTAYGWGDTENNLVQVSIFIGQCLGFFACLAQNHYYARRVHLTRHATIHDSQKESKALGLPETRLYILLPGTFLGLAGGLFLYGWTARESLPWPVPAIGLALTGFGSIATMQPIMMYVTDGYAKYAASASAAVCFGENMFAAFLPFAAQPIYRSLGTKWASSLLGFIAIGLGLAPAALIRWGHRVRARSPFMNDAMYHTM